MPVRIWRSGRAPTDDLLATTTPAERLAMVWAITRDVWALSGRTIPDYSRAAMPIRVIRLEDER